MDDIDARIISLLVTDGRASLRELGAQVHLSTPAVKRRFDRLRAAGVITGFTATLDADQLGWRTQAFVSVKFRRSASPAESDTMLRPISEVVAAYTVSGSADVLLHIRAESMTHFERVLEGLRSMPLIGQTETIIVLSELFSRPAPAG